MTALDHEPPLFAAGVPRVPRIDRFALLVGIVMATKLAIAVQQRPSFYLTASYDDGNYINRAQMFAQGNWATRFDELTFIRGPLYSLYLASVSRSGLPLPFCDTLVQLASCWFLAHEVARFAERGRAVRAVVFTALLLIPIAETLTGGHVIRDNLAYYLQLAIIACALRCLRSSRRWLWAPITVFGVGLTSILREDAVWILPALVVLVAVVVFGMIRARRGVLASATVAVCVVGFLGPRLVVTELNQRAGLDAPTLFDDTHFVRAHQALARYSNDGTENPYSFTVDMFNQLAARSPSLAAIANGFLEWRRGDVIYVDAIRFGIGSGLDRAGLIADSQSRSASLDGIADEVDQLCLADRRPACATWAGPPPIPVVRSNDLVAALIRPATGFEQMIMVEGPPGSIRGTDSTVALLRSWERITNTSPAPGSYVIDGDNVIFGPTPNSVGRILESAYLWTCRVLTPLLRVAGLVAFAAILIRRRWRVVAVAAVLLGTAWIRASQVALATRFRIGDYDFHYVHPAATCLSVAGLICLASLRSPRRVKTFAGDPTALDSNTPAG